MYQPQRVWARERQLWAKVDRGGSGLLRLLPVKDKSTLIILFVLSASPLPP